jgi:hypothetical protein
MSRDVELRLTISAAHSSLVHRQLETFSRFGNFLNRSHRHPGLLSFVSSGEDIHDNRGYICV